MTRESPPLRTLIEHCFQLEFDLSPYFSTMYPMVSTLKTESSFRANSNSCPYMYTTHHSYFGASGWPSLSETKIAKDKRTKREAQNYRGLRKWITACLVSYKSHLITCEVNQKVKASTFSYRYFNLIFDNTLIVSYIKNILTEFFVSASVLYSKEATVNKKVDVILAYVCNEVSINTLNISLATTIHFNIKLYIIAKSKFPKTGSFIKYNIWW